MKVTKTQTYSPAGRVGATKPGSADASAPAAASAVGGSKAPVKLSDVGRKLAAVFHWYEIPNNANFYAYRAAAPTRGRIASRGRKYCATGPIDSANTSMRARSCCSSSSAIRCAVAWARKSEHR